MFQLETTRVKVAKRGKSAKGTVSVAVYGTPFLNEDGIAKGFDYGKFISIEPAELVSACLLTGPINVPLMKGKDVIAIAAAMKSQNETTALAEYLLSENLAFDKAESLNVAKKMIQSKNQSVGIGGTTAEAELNRLIAQRQAYCRSQVSVGPRLVPRVILTDSPIVPPVVEEVDEFDSPDFDDEEESN